MSSDIAAVNIDKLREEIKALRNEIARLNNQTNWVCKCGGTDTKGQKENEEQARLLGQGAEREARLLGRIGELQKERASLNATLDVVIVANERAIALWREAHPGNHLVVPDQTKMVEWLLEELAKFDDPHRLHAHCVRHLTDAQVAHLFGERMTEVANDRDRLEAANVALKIALDHQTKYQRELRADRDRLDWLMTQKHIRYPFAPHDDGEALRERIDAAMLEGKQ